MAGIFDGSYLGVPVTGIFDTSIFDTFDGVITTGCTTLTDTIASSQASLTSTAAIQAALTTTRICE